MITTAPPPPPGNLQATVTSKSGLDIYLATSALLLTFWSFDII